MDGAEREALVSGWKERLLAAIEADGKSARAISMAAGLGPNFVTQLREGREPGVKHVIKLTDALGVSLTHLFVGGGEIALTPEEKEFLRLLRQSPEAERQALLLLLRARRPRTREEEEVLELLRQSPQAERDALTQLLRARAGSFGRDDR
jgi:transcriptional regulator with XRE-family HTH domain